jgi:hypothetical protein
MEAGTGADAVHRAYRARLEAKFLALTMTKLGRDRAEELLGAIRRDDFDIAAYARLTRSP